MIQVINRALNILEVLAQDPNKEFGLSEIAATTDLNAGTCANILKTLVLRNYVEQPNVKKGYKLGYMIYHLTRDNFYNTELINISKVAMENLRDSINETVILSIIKGNKRILLHESQCTHEIQVRTTNESSVYRATTGRMILSFYSPKELNDFIEKVGLPTEDEWPEAKSKAELIRLLHEIHSKSFELSWNKNHVVGLATPIIRKGKVIASLGIYLPDIRFGKSEKNNIIKQLKIATEHINKQLNASTTSFSK